MSYNAIINKYKSIPISKYYSDVLSKNIWHKEMLDKHKEFEIARVVNGDAIITVHNFKINISKGDIIFLSPHMLHGFKVEPDSLFEYENLSFDTSMILDKTLKESLDTGKIYMEIYIGCNNSHYKHINELYNMLDADLKNEKPYYEMCIYANLNLIFAYMMQSKLYVNSDKPSKETIFCQKAIEYLTEHYAENINSKTMAEEFHYEQSYFCRMFKRSFGIIFSEYLCLFRLEKAKFLLLESVQMPVTQVAIQSGFSGLSYFTRKFKELNGMTPREFRKKNKKINL